MAAENLSQRRDEAVRTVLKIEWPVLLPKGGLWSGHDFDWQPGRLFWNGRLVRNVPEPWQAPL